MKREMRYNFKFLKNNSLQESFRRNRACFAALSYPGGTLTEITWDFDHQSGITVEEFKELFTYLFTTGEQYGVQFEFQETYVDHPNKVYNPEWGDSYQSDKPWTRVVISSVENYPRSLFMNKLFMIRNLGRYAEHYVLFKKLLSNGVSLGIAAYIGANFHKTKALVENTNYTLISYAESLYPPHRICEIRNAANCKHHLMSYKGEPWSTGGGYHNVCKSIKKDIKRNCKQFKSPTLESLATSRDFYNYYEKESLNSIVNKLMETRRTKDFFA